MHFIWQGLFNEVVFADADRWRASHPGEVHISFGYPVALGTFGTNGIFLGAFFFQTACLIFATSLVPTGDGPSDTSRTPHLRLRKISLALSLLAVVFLSWPLIVGWISRLATPALGENAIPF